MDIAKIEQLVSMYIELDEDDQKIRIGFSPL